MLCSGSKLPVYISLWPGLANFVRMLNDSMGYNVDMLTSYGWYDPCSQIYS